MTQDQFDEIINVLKNIADNTENLTAMLDKMNDTEYNTDKTRKTLDEVLARVERIEKNLP